MVCKCGSFQCTCQETCICTANVCCCESCTDLRSKSPVKLDVFQEISPTRGTTTLLTGLQITDNQQTSVSSNNGDRKLLFVGWASYCKPLSNSSEQSPKKTCKVLDTDSSPDLPKTRSPKRKFSTTKGDSSPLDIKRMSPCKNDHSLILPETANMGASSPDTKANSNKTSGKCAESSPIYVRDRNTASQNALCIPKDFLVVFNETRRIHPTKISPSNKDAAVIQKSIRLPTEHKYSCSSSSANGCTSDKMLSTQPVNKLLSNQDSKSEAHQKDNCKSKCTEEKQSTNLREPSNSSLPISGTDTTCEARASERPTSYVQSSDKSITTSNTSHSQQESSNQSSSASKKADAFVPVETLGIPGGFVDIDAKNLMFQTCVDELSEKWVGDEDNESSFAPQEVDPEAANSSTDSATSQELLQEERIHIVPSPEMSIFEANELEISIGSPENQVVPDVD